MHPLKILRLVVAAALFGWLATHCAAAEIQVREVKDGLEIETDQLAARIKRRATSAASPPAASSTRRRVRATSASACTSWTFCMAPGWRDDGYTRDPKFHGDLPKHYVEGPQICTQAKELKPEIVRGQGLRRRAS